MVQKSLAAHACKSYIWLSMSDMFWLLVMHALSRGTTCAVANPVHSASSRHFVLSPAYSDRFMQGLIPAAEQCEGFPKFIASQGDSWL